MDDQLKILQSTIFNSPDFSFSNIVIDPESTDYAAASFVLSNHSILFRSAKTTPTKTGQFVTLWKRISNGPIQPFSENDAVDFAVIHVSQKEKTGYFIFPKKTLLAKNIFSTKDKIGKLAMRVYAPWDDANSLQAKKTKQWQNDFFFEKRNARASKRVESGANSPFSRLLARAFLLP